MQLVTDPTRFDVLLLENLYGDIMSDLCAGLVGGLGVVPGATVGDDCAVFEAVHGSAPDIAGKRLANPTALILSAAEMLRHLGELESAERVESAVRAALGEPACRTRDLGGRASLDEFTDSVIERLG
jgi:isocitrate dehydrogenase (NAD+)